MVVLDGSEPVPLEEDLDRAARCRYRSRTWGKDKGKKRLPRWAAGQCLSVLHTAQ